MAVRKKTNKGGSRDWTSVRQTRKRKPGTRIAWWRRIKIRFQTVVLWLAGACGLAFLVLAVSYFTSNPLDVNLTGPSGKVGKMEFQTNGNLGHQWLVDTLGLPRDMRLMDVDLHELKNRLKAVGQIAGAEVQRRHPDVLRVSVTEHLPILKIYIADPEQGKKCLLVSDAGVVFDGVGHPDALVAGLPILFGGRLFKSPDGFLPLEVVKKIKPLLDTTRKHYPYLLRDWSRIRFDVARAGKDLEGLIRIRSKRAREVIFSTDLDYLTQLQRLDYVLTYSSREGWTPLTLIDLPGRQSATVRLSGDSSPTGNRNTLLF